MLPVSKLSKSARRSSVTRLQQFTTLGLAIDDCSDSPLVYTHSGWTVKIVCSY